MDTIIDDCSATTPDVDPRSWTGPTTFLTAGSQVGQDVSSDRVEAQLADMASSRPWGGDQPPVSIYVDAASCV